MRGDFRTPILQHSSIPLFRRDKDIDDLSSLQCGAGPKERGKSSYQRCSYRRQTVDWQSPTVWRP
jgi:hypothetical protein